MSLVIFGLVVVAAAVAVGTLFVAGAAAVARNNRKRNQVVPGIESKAPANWSGAHELEAVLHRRIRDAVAGLNTIAGDDPSMASTIASVERDALNLDNQLVAAALLAPRFKHKALEELADAVAQLEEITATAVGRSARSSSRSVKDQLDDLAIRLESMQLARAEVDEADKQGRTESGY